MNLGVLRLDQIMSILLTMNKLRLCSLFTAHAEHNLIKLKHIIIDQRKMLTDNVSECAM